MTVSAIKNIILEVFHQFTSKIEVEDNCLGCKFPPGTGTKIVSKINDVLAGKANYRLSLLGKERVILVDINKNQPLTEGEALHARLHALSIPHDCSLYSPNSERREVIEASRN